MANRDTLAIGASAGGVEALLKLAESLPREFPATVLVTMHLASHTRSVLDDLLSRAGPLPASFARDKERLRKGHIFIAPPDRHLILEGDRLLLGRGPRENRARPAIDPMMRSVALCCGPRAIGIVLTGTLSDGASGLWAIGQCGGMTVVQDPSDATFPDMPTNALNRLRPDHVVTLAAMPNLLNSLVSQPEGEPMPVPESIQFEVEIAKGSSATIAEMDQIGARSPFACPDCHGAMWELDEGEVVRYRCHVGHTYTAEVLSLVLDETLRRALASALRALEERRTLLKGLQRQAERSKHSRLAASWAHRAQEAEQELVVLRNSIARLDRIVAPDEGARAAE
jgi:two-component system chemotaxis response regulator CheB